LVNSLITSTASYEFSLVVPPSKELPKDLKALCDTSLDRLHIRVLQKALGGLRKCTPLAATYGLTGIFPFTIQNHIATLRLWKHILEDYPENSITRICCDAQFQQLKKEPETAKHLWAAYIQKLLTAMEAMISGTSSYARGHLPTSLPQSQNISMITCGSQTSGPNQRWISSAYLVSNAHHQSYFNLMMQAPVTPCSSLSQAPITFELKRVDGPNQSLHATFDHAPAYRWVLMTNATSCSIAPSIPSIGRSF